MVSNYSTGYAADEQEYILAMDDFLVNHVGWYRIDTIADTGTDRDYVWMSDGEPDWADNIYPRIIRMRGNGNYVYLYTYETYTDSVTFTGEVYNVTYTRIQDMITGIWYTLIGDKERFINRHRSSGLGTSYHAPSYLGRIKSEFDSSLVPYPNLVKGCRYVNSEWGGVGVDDRSYSYSPTGVLRYSYIYSFSSLADSDIPNSRNGKYGSFPANTYSSENSSDYFLPGQLRGCYQVSRLLQQESFLTLASGTHKVMKDGGSLHTWAYGPCTDPRIGDINRIPPVYAQVDYDFRGFVTNVNTLANWRLDSDTTGVYVDQVGEYNLTPLNSPTLSNSPLVQSVVFDGSTQSATVSGTVATSSALTGEWTCEVMFKPDTIPGSGKDTIIEFGTNSDGTEAENTLLSVSLAPSGNINVFWERGAAGTDESNTTTGDFILVDRWNYVAVVKRSVGGGNYDVEVWHSSFGDHNPVLRETFSTISNSTGGADSFWFLGVDASLTDFYGGSVDAVRVQKEALSEESIKSSLYRVRL
jgi:hypothetical protein